MQFFNRIKSDKVDVKVKRARGVFLKHITYTSYNSKVNLNKIDRVIGAQRNHLLCTQTFSIPKSCGYKRFYSPEFSARLCSNMALQVLRCCVNASNLKIGIYDEDAKMSDLLAQVLCYSSDVRVVTEKPSSYYDVLASIMDEQGATAVVTNRVAELSECNFIISPYSIDKELNLRRDALVLTNESPKVITNGLVFYKYSFKMPNGFDIIKPLELDEEYFCSALYTLASQYQLGSIVPTVCRNYSSSQTLESLCAYINRFA